MSNGGNWPVRHFTWLKQSVKEFGRTDPLVLASSIAFFTIFALPGVLVILLQVAGVLFEAADVRNGLLDQVSGSIGAGAAEKLDKVLADVRISDSSIGQQIVSIAGILISATMAFVALQRGLNKIWGVKIEKGQGLKKQLVTRGIGLLVMAGMSFLLPLSLLFDDLLVFLVDQFGLPFSSDAWKMIISQFISFLLMFVTMSVFYKVLPNAKIHWNDVWAGAVLATVLFMVLRHLVGLYIEITDIGRAFGAGKGILVLLVWMFMTAMIILFGAFHCHTVALAQGHGIDPGRHAKAVDGADARSR